jgi:cytochrome c2
VAKKKTRLEEESYRLWFFIIGQLLMLSMVWLVYQEFFSRRPWKDVQLGWFQVEKARANKNLEAEQKFLKSGTLTVKDEDGEEEEIDVGERVATLQKEIAELEGAIVDSPKYVEFTRLKQELAEAEIVVKDEEMRLAFSKADEDEYYYYYRHAKHAGHDDHIAEAEAEYEARHKIVLEKSAIYDAATAKRDAILDKVAAFQTELNAKKAELAKFESGLAAAQRTVDSTKEQWTSIEQFWNQEIDLVDRCHTCHVGWNKCGYAHPEEILNAVLYEGQKAADIRKFYCVTRTEAEAYMEAAEEIRDSWYEDEKLTFEDVKDKLYTAGAPEDAAEKVTEPVLATAMNLGVKQSDADVLYRTHPDYWGLMTKHPVQTYGCTTCHYGQGRQTKGVALNYLAAYLWDGARHLAPFDHATSDHYWIEQILDNDRNHTEASCFNCHEKDYELDFAPNLTEGRKLVQHLGCTGCHPLGELDPERNHGPPLTAVKSKIDVAWMNAWIQNPHQIRSRTRMPNFWPTAVDKEGKRDASRNDCNAFDYAKGGPPAPAVWMNCADQRDEESGYIMAYLLDQSEEPTMPTMPASADAAKGQEIVEKVGCRGCHNLDEWTQASHMPGSEARDLAPNLTEIGDKLKNPGWIYQWVKNPKGWWKHTRMPSLRLTDEEAWNVAAYLSGKSAKSYQLPARTQAAMDKDDAAERGKKLIGYYGCFGCHDIKGFEGQSRIGADLTLFGSKLPHKLDFGDVEELISDPHNQTWEAWLRQKLAAPRSYTYERATTRMPKFQLTDREIDQIVLFLKSQNEMDKDYPEHVKHMQDERDVAIQRGEYLLDAYNCSGCHLIDKQGIDVDGDHKMDGGDIFRLYAGTDDQYRAPPKLIREGAKVYPDWFYKFLKEPFKLRENYEIRMPTFQFDDETAQQIVAYFAAKANTGYPYVEKKVDVLSAADRATADKLFNEAQCLNCHTLGGDPPTDPKNVAPNLTLTYERLQYDWLFHWFKNPQEQQPGVGMPNFFIPVDDEPGVYETPLTDIADGDWRRQIELLRAYVIELGYKKKMGEAESAESKPKKKKKRRG